MPRDLVQMVNERLRRILPFAGPATALGAVAAAWVVSSPYTIRRAFLADVAFVAIGAGVILVILLRTVRRKQAITLVWLTCGGLLVASLVGPLPLAPWVALAALGVSFAATRLGSSCQPRLLGRLGLLAAGAALNGVLLWVLLFGGYRPLRATEFEAHPLRAHAFLADVPLHDVWRVRLRGGGSGDRTIEDVLARLNDGFAEPPNAAVAGLVAVRSLIGLVFSLDDQECADPVASFAHRLSAADRARSHREPGENGVLYVFEREALLELVNCTVHAFIVAFVEPAEDGYRLTVGVYVKQNRAITPYYMALIDPFRRLIVYPVVIEHMERYWARVMNAAPASSPTTSLTY